MLAILLTILITFFVGNLFGYVVHRILHKPWSGYLYKKHLVHHQVLYPPTNYVSDKYRNAGKDNTARTFIIIALPLIILPIILWLVGCLPLFLMITVLVVEGLVGFFNNYLHDSFHIRDHWMYQVPLFGLLFKHWVYLHWLHHVRTDTNYSIFWFVPDKLFGTFWNDKENKDDLPFMP
jgi:hypothetical protein